MNLHSGLSSKLISGGGLFISIAHHDGFPDSSIVSAIYKILDFTIGTS